MSTSFDIKRLVVESQISSATNYLFETFNIKGTHFENDVLTLEARWKKCQRNRIIGLSSNEEIQVEENRIKWGLLETIDIIRLTFEQKSISNSVLSKFTLKDEFKVIIDSHTTNFTGRKYFLEKIFQYTTDRNFPGGYVLVKGEPGIGKTALAAKLVKDYGFVHHFNSKTQNIRSAKSFLGNICAQLIDKYNLNNGNYTEQDLSSNYLFLKLLREASEKLNNTPLVLVIDALDEAEEPLVSQNENILNLPQTVPIGVYIIITSRIKYHDRLYVDNQREILIEDRGIENFKDINEYIHSFCSKNSSSISNIIDGWNISEKDFISTLSLKSEGNFQYLHHVLPAILNGTFGPNNIDAIYDLPSGLKSYYQQHWRKMKSRNLHYYEQFQKPVLCFIASSREPISIATLIEWTSLARSEIQPVIKEWREFLNHRKMSSEISKYHLYHFSFSEFLNDEESLYEFHQKIVQNALKKLGN